MNTFSVRIPEETKRQLLNVAKRYGLSISELIRIVLILIIKDEIALTLLQKDRSKQEGKI